jgi:hypothetical protein
VVDEDGAAITSTNRLMPRTVSHTTWAPVQQQHQQLPGPTHQSGATPPRPSLSVKAARHVVLTTTAEGTEPLLLAEDQDYQALLTRTAGPGAGAGASTSFAPAGSVVVSMVPTGEPKTKSGLEDVASAAVRMVDEELAAMRTVPPSPGIEGQIPPSNGQAAAGTPNLQAAAPAPAAASLDAPPSPTAAGPRKSRLSSFGGNPFGANNRNSAESLLAGGQEHLQVSPKARKGSVSAETLGTCLGCVAQVFSSGCEQFQ